MKKILALLIVISNASLFANESHLKYCMKNFARINRVHDKFNEVYYEFAMRRNEAKKNLSDLDSSMDNYNELKEEATQKLKSIMKEGAKILADGKKFDASNESIIKECKDAEEQFGF